MMVAPSGWGVGPWGTGAWGIGSGPTLAVTSPVIADVRGGTVIGLFGTNFVDPTVVEIIDGPSVIGRAEYFEARLDLRATKLLVGTPALPAGTYDIRITTPAGVVTLPEAITYKAFADEGKILRVRRRFARIWATGERIVV